MQGSGVMLPGAGFGANGSGFIYCNLWCKVQRFRTKGRGFRILG